MVFHSSRSGTAGLWVADADGLKRRRTVSSRQGHAGSPSWSPDGQTVAFDWYPTGKFQIYTIRAIGDKPTAVTGDDVGSNTIPSWSRDGKWIYVASTRSGRSEVWKVSPSGGSAVQLTRNGGGMPKESFDGRFVYFTKGDSIRSIWKVPVDGGEESPVVETVYGRNFALGSQGTYWISTALEGGKHSLNYVAFAGGKPKTVLMLPHAPNMGMNLSPDGRSPLFTQVEQNSRELVLVENFR